MVLPRYGKTNTGVLVLWCFVIGISLQVVISLLELGGIFELLSDMSVVLAWIVLAPALVWWYGVLVLGVVRLVNAQRYLPWGFFNRVERQRKRLCPRCGYARPRAVEDEPLRCTECGVNITRYL